MIYFEAHPDEKRLNDAVATARKAIELDDRDAMTHFTCGRALLARKDYEGAIAELHSAVELNPNMAVGYCGLADSLAYEGRFAEAIPYFEKAIQLSPHDPQRWAYYSYRSLAHLLAGEFELAVEWAQNAIRVPNSHYWPLAHRVSALGTFAADLRTARRRCRTPATQARVHVLVRARAIVLYQESGASRKLSLGPAQCGDQGMTSTNTDATRVHWDELYSHRPLDQVSWFEPSPRAQSARLDHRNGCRVRCADHRCRRWRIDIGR